MIKLYCLACKIHTLKCFPEERLVKLVYYPGLYPGLKIVNFFLISELFLINRE